MWEKVDLQDSQLMPHLKCSSAIKIDESSIFLFGGYDQKGECTDTSIIIDTGNPSSLAVL